MADESTLPDAVDFEGIVLECDEVTRSQFREAFPSDVSAIIEGLAAAYAAIREFEANVEKDVRAAWVDVFLFNALDCIASSSKLFLMGLVIPAGNLMRQYGEACAMAMLSSHDGLQVLQRLESAEGYPTHTAIHYVSKKKVRGKLKIDTNGWDEFAAITRWYDRFSHASSMSVASIVSLSESGFYVLGGGFDAAKADTYRKELRLRGSACDVLKDLAAHVMGLVQASQKRGLVMRESE